MAGIVFLSCHLSGTGHLVRTLTLARAAQARGHDAVVISGGRPLDHLASDDVEMIQLPPVSIQGFEFSVLRRPDGEPVDDGYMDSRRTAIAAALARLAPDVLVTELYPFGRRVLRREFGHAVDQARRFCPDGLVLSSVRDIPEPKPKRLGEVVDRLRRDFDGVLVHGDAGFVPLQATWPLPGDLDGQIHHTGYVTRRMPAPSGPRGDYVLVSCGGGALGRRLSEVAAQAAALGDRPWHILVGGKDACDVVNWLRGEHHTPGLTIGAVRPDFPDLLVGAACSVSLCGYNTAAELAQCRTPAILVPSAEADEREQGLRADRFARLPGLRVLEMAGLDPAILSAAVEDMARGPDRVPTNLALDDGTAAIERIEALLAGRNGR